MTLVCTLSGKKCLMLPSQRAVKVVLGVYRRNMKYFCGVISAADYCSWRKTRAGQVDICGLMLKRSLARNQVPNNFLMMLHRRAHAGSALDEGDAAACEEVSVAAV